jgi:Tfp pilus assembly protein PilF
MAVSRAQAALAVSDPRTVEIELARAIDLQPRYGYYAESMAFLYEQGGFFEAAFTEMDRGARLQPGIPYIALKAARAGLAVGRMDAAAYWYERALEADPNGVTAITEAAEFYSSEGKSNLASTLMESFESLGSSNTAVWKTAERVYLALGDDAHAEKAAACYGAGGIPIPDDC